MKTPTLLLLAVTFLIPRIALGDQTSVQGTSVGATASTPTAPTGSFDPSPKTIRACVISVNDQHRTVLLSQPDGPQIEMAVPMNAAIYSANHDVRTLSDLQPGTTYQIRYHPLTVEAIELQQTETLE
jgi:hypothetical protein